MDEIVELDSYQDHHLWIDGIICAFQFIQGTNNVGHSSAASSSTPTSSPDRWVPIGWSTISKLVESVPVSAASANLDSKETVPVAVLAPPFKEQAKGPTWWCHLNADHSDVQKWLQDATWLHPAVSLALRRQSKQFREMSRSFSYEVPLRAAGGLLFELCTNTFNDRYKLIDQFIYIDRCRPVTFRFWQAQNFLLSVVHSRKNAPNIPGLSAFKELLYLGEDDVPKNIHEMIAHLVCSISRWDYRLFNNFVFGSVEQFELEFRKRDRAWELSWDLPEWDKQAEHNEFLFNREMDRVTSQLNGLKLLLDARDDLCSELLHHLRGSIPQTLLEVLILRTRDLLEKQSVYRERLYMLQDTMHNTRASLVQEKSVRITHKLAVVGGCGLILSLLIGLMGVNLDGLPFVKAFWWFCGLLGGLALVMAGVCLKWCALRFASRKDKARWLFEEWSKEQKSEGAREIAHEEFEKMWGERAADAKMLRDDNIIPQQEIRIKDEAEEIMEKTKVEKMEKKKAQMEKKNSIKFKDMEKAL